MNKIQLALVSLLFAGGWVAAQELSPYAGPGAQEILSPVYSVKDKYRSMMGPQSTQKLFLHKTEQDELLWITGYRAQMVGPDGHTPMSQEFMCHSNLDFNASEHRTLFKWKKNTSGRLFTLSQGQFEIEFPKGFGIPVMASEALSLTTQVLNLNIEKPDLQVRHKIKIDFVRDKDLKSPMTPLFLSAANGMVLVEGKDAFYNIEAPDPEKHGTGCLLGASATNKTGNYKDKFGRSFAGHWIVPPGRQVNKSNVTKFMNLPFDTRIHYIAVHLHPFAESLELKDLTSGRVVFKSNVKKPRGKIGIESVEYLSSVEGVPVYKDHQYELTSVYNNTTKENVDSMAVMFLYVRDMEFQKPASGAPIQQVAGPEACVFDPKAAKAAKSSGAGMGM